jgi:hypothetical protein
VKRLLRALLLLAVLLLVLAAASPGLVYLAALSRVHGRPEPGNAPPLSVEQQNWLRCELGAGDEVHPSVTNPWQLAFHFLREDTMPGYGDRLAWIVTQDYAHAQPDQATLSSMALFVWVARHWTTQQLEARAHELLHPPRLYHCPPGPGQWPVAPPAK